MDWCLLAKHLDPVKDDWKTLGLYLSIELSVIQDIEKESPDNVKQCQDKLLKCWVIQNPSGSWDDVIAAIEKLNRKDLADNMRSKFTTHDRPTVQQLVTELDEVEDLDGFGLALGVPMSKIRGIKLSDPHGGLTNWKINLFNFWLGYDVDASWEKVIQALKKTKNNVLAADLRRKYLKSPDTSVESVDPPSQRVIHSSSESPRQRRSLGSTSSTRREVPRTGSSRPPPSMVNVRNIGLCACMLIVAGALVSVLIIPYQTMKNEKDSSTIDRDQKMKPFTPFKCHKIDRSTDVYLYLKQEDFSMTNTKDFGLYLKLTNGELNNLKEDSGGRTADFLNGVVDLWYKKFPSACWETIYHALVKLPNLPLANKVKQEYMKD